MQRRKELDSPVLHGHVALRLGAALRRLSRREVVVERQALHHHVQVGGRDDRILADVQAIPNLLRTRVARVRLRRVQRHLKRTCSGRARKYHHMSNAEGQGCG